MTAKLARAAGFPELTGSLSLDGDPQFWAREGPVVGEHNGEGPLSPGRPPEQPALSLPQMVSKCSCGPRGSLKPGEAKLLPRRPLPCRKVDLDGG